MENTNRPENPAPSPAQAPGPAGPPHRGAYITLGAVIVLAVLVVAGVYGPKYAKTHALGGSAAAPAPSAPAPPAAPTAPAAVPAAPVPAPAAPVKAAVPAKPQVAEAPPGPSPKQLEELRDQIDQLLGRTAAVNAGLDSLQKQEAAQGYGLRGDMVAAQGRMQTDVARAQSALRDKDVDGTQKYIGMAEAETEKLEKFLGR